MRHYPFGLLSVLVCGVEMAADFLASGRSLFLVQYSRLTGAARRSIGSGFAARYIP